MSGSTEFFYQQVRQYFKAPKVLFFSYFIILFLVYGAFLNNPFVMDDEIHIVENRHIHQIEDWPEFFTSSSMDSGGQEKMQGIYYKPLLMTYFSVVWHFFGNEPMAYRVGNYLFHSLNAGLIFIFSLAFFSIGAAYSIGLLFLLHPVTSEVVLYICDSQDSLYMLFGLLSLLVVQKIKSTALSIFLLFICFWLALFSKETGGLFLALATVYSWFFAREKLKWVVPVAFTVALGYVFLRFTIGLTSADSHHLIFHQVDYATRALTFPLIWAKYIELLFFPYRLSLTTDFAVMSVGLFTVVLPSFVVLLFGVVLFRIKKDFVDGSRPLYWFLLSIFFFWFVLHSHILVPLDGVYTDRWVYLAVWAFVTMVVYVLHKRLPSRLFVSVMILISTLFVGRNVVRAMDWASPLRLYQRELKLHPFDATMSNNVGVILFRNGYWQEAKPYFVRSTELNPSWNVAWNNWGAIEEREGRFDKALELYRKSFTVGAYALAIENYARLLLKMGRNQEGRSFIQWALQHYPYNPTLLSLNAELQRRNSQ